MSLPVGSMSGVCVAVTGPGGFIGGAVCRRALVAGARVTGLGPGDVAAHPQLRHVPALIGDAASLAAVLDGADVVVHAAGRGTPASVESMDGPVAQEELQLAAIVLEAAHMARVRRVVLVSSGGTVYGDTGGTALIGEGQPVRPSSRYGAVKVMIEQMALAMTRAGLLDCVIARVANPYGPGQLNLRGQGLVATLIELMLRGRKVPVWGDGAAVRDYLFIDDAAAGLLAAAGLPGDTVCNVGSGVGRSVMEVIRDVSAALGVPARLDVMAGRDRGVARNVLDHALLTGQTGWRPATAWEDGLRQTVAWWQAASSRATSAA